MAAGAHGSSRQLQDDVDAFSKEELARRPEVRLINRYMRWFFFLFVAVLSLARFVYIRGD
jgi:hypothetical protein